MILSTSVVNMPITDSGVVNMPSTHSGVVNMPTTDTDEQPPIKCKCLNVFY